ncbi:hypothetical protein TGAMA5MH_00644 [Trichoderma gamsii]|uniref:Myb-like DNA-binding protein FlbD n=1 Tax=Trichoderma gamsii TaxID=398673 RepID=A0A2K0TS48_9HYPO|nr:hypothetical protein TGAMA5MH_00644 [Trichoderma gamsii]
MSDTAGPVVQREVDFIPIEDLLAMSPKDISQVAMTGKYPQRRGPWSPDESFRLVTLINKTGAQNWVTVASFMGSRNAKQCRERYHQNLDPSLRHDPIAEDEAAKIMDLYHRYGSAWARIAEQLPGRSDNAIKNYVNGLVNKTRRAEGRLAGQHPRPRTTARRRSSAAAAAAAPSSVLAAASLSTPSSGTPAVESPTFSDMAESDSGNNYSLSSSWGQFAASSGPQTSQRTSSEWYRPLSQSPELAHPHIHHPAPHSHQTFRVSPYGQTQPHQNGYQQESWRPMSRSSEPSSTRRLSTDLARFSLSSRRSSRDSNMLTPSPTLSATLPHGRKADPRMAIGNLLG